MTTVDTAAVALQPVPAASGGRRTWNFLTAAILGAYALAALAPALLAPHSPLDAAGSRLQPMSLNHPLGTDQLGRDLLSRVIWGARTSVPIALGAATLGGVVGAALGMAAAWRRSGFARSLTARMFDTILAFPQIVIGIVAVAALGSSIPVLILAIALTLVPQFGRLALNMTTEELAKDYVAAARSYGARRWRILGKEVLGNILGVLLAQWALAAAFAVLLEASLGYLGLGVPLPAPSWGEMLAESQNYWYDAPVYVIAPGIALTLFVLVLGRLGSHVARAHNRSGEARG